MAKTKGQYKTFIDQDYRQHAVIEPSLINQLFEIVHEGDINNITNFASINNLSLVIKIELVFLAISIWIIS